MGPSSVTESQQDMRMHANKFKVFIQKLLIKTEAANASAIIVTENEYRG